MKKLYFAVLVATFLLIQPLYPIYAEESTTSGIRTAIEKAQIRLVQKTDEARKTEFEKRMLANTNRLKAKLNTFKDKNRAKIVERLNDLLKMINQKRTEQMGKYLDKTEEVLDKVELRAAKLDGEASASAQTSITKAKTSIETARDAVEEQSLKDYTVTIASESAARADIKKTRDLLHTDLKTVRNLLIEARQAVGEAIRTVARAQGENNE